MVRILQIQMEKSVPDLREGGVYQCVGPRHVQTNDGLPGWVLERKWYNIQFLRHIVECRRRIQGELKA